MYPHAYAFNHDRVAGKLTANVEKVVFSIARVRIPSSHPERKIQHIIAQFLKSDGNDAHPPEFGCPYPPGWQDDGYEVPEGGLNACPQFSITKAELSDSLTQNKFKVDSVGQLRVDVIGTFESIHHRSMAGVEKDHITLVANLNIISLNLTGSTINKTLQTKTIPPAP